MANTIGSLVIDLVANTASFAAQLNSSVKNVEETVEKMKSAFGKLGEIFTVAGIAKLTDDILEFGDEIEKSATKTGLGTNAISELAFAAKQANIDLPSLTSAFDKMEKSISDATTGTAAQKEAFSALGISLDQLRTLSPDQQFAEIANQISKLPTATDKARAAIDIFGRSGADLLPLFEQGAAGIEEARQKAVAFGASLDADQVQKLATANMAVKDLGASFSALATTLVAKVSPGISGFFDSLTEIVTQNKAALLAREIENLQQQLDYASQNPGDPIIAEIQGQIAKAQIALQGVQLAKQIADQLAAANSSLSNANAPGFQPEIKPVVITAQKQNVDAMKVYYDQLDEATQTGAEKLLTDTAKLQAQLDVLLHDGVINLSESLKREFDSDNQQQFADFFAQNAEQIQLSIKQTSADGALWFKQIADQAKLAGDKAKEYFDKMQSNAKQAADGIESAFADFLLNPFDGGLKKMLSSWIQILAQMEAKAASAQLFEKLFPSGDGGLAGFLGSLFGGGTPASYGNPGLNSGDTSDFLAGLSGLSHYANGGSFAVGGSGGTDSQLVAFKATPGEQVTVTTPGQAGAGAIHLTQNINIDARTDRAQIGQLIQASTQIAIQKSRSQIVDMARRGAFSGI